MADFPPDVSEDPRVYQLYEILEHFDQPGGYVCISTTRKIIANQEITSEELSKCLNLERHHAYSLCACLAKLWKDKLDKKV